MSDIYGNRQGPLIDHADIQLSKPHRPVVSVNLVEVQ